MSRNPEVLFDYECRRRPALALLAERLPTMSTAEIMQAKVPLKWMRQVLLARKQRHTMGLENARQLAALGDRIVDGHRPDPPGELRRWTAAPTFLRLPRGSSIEVVTGALLWLPLSGGMWIETIFAPTIDPQLARASEPVGLISKSAYMSAYRAATNRLVGAASPLLSQTTGYRALAAYGVRFG